MTDDAKIKKKILVVEDDADLRRGLQIRLAANGYQVFTAADGASAIGVARREEPDLILLDLGLPAGDGFVVMARLQALASASGIPIVVVTAQDPHTSEQRALDAGARAFLRKPVDNHVLLGVIRAILGV